MRDIFDDGVPVGADALGEACELAESCVRDGAVGLAADLLLAVAMRCWWVDPGEECLRRVARIAAGLPGLADDARVTATLALTCPIAEAWRVLAVLDRTRPARCEPHEARLLGVAAHVVGDPARANELLAVAEAGLRAEKRVGLLPQLRSVRIPVSLVLGDLATAAEAAADTQRLAPRTHQPIWTVSSRVGAAMTAALRGDAEEAADLAAAAERQIRHRGIPALLAFVHLAAGGRC